MTSLSSYKAVKDPDGSWRFILMAQDGEAKVVMGLEDDQGRSGMLETSFRKLLTNEFRLAPDAVDRAVRLAKGEPEKP
jgi:hypothetical protein